jgi:hypothetical protein
MSVTAKHKQAKMICLGLQMIRKMLESIKKWCEWLWVTGRIEFADCYRGKEL